MAKKKKKSFVAKVLGIDVEKAETPAEEEAAERHKMILKAWEWVRREVDRGAKEYLENGNPATLQEYTSPALFQAITNHLNFLHSQGIVWFQPDRAVSTRAQVELVNEKLDRQNRPTEFIVRERFSDNSVYRSLAGDTTAPGTEHVIQGRVEVKNGDQFRLISVTEIKGVSV